MTLRDLLVISGLCFLTEDADEAIRLSLTKEVVHLFGEDAFERMDAIEASNEETVEVMLQILRSLAVDQELLDVKAGIPARDAEIATLRKENEQLRQAINLPVSAEPVAWVRRHPDGALTAELLEHAVIEPVRKNSGAWVPLYTAPVAAQAQPLDIQPIEITDSMALAFHNAITDGSVGQEDVDDIKTGLRAVFANILDMRPHAQQPVSGADGLPTERVLIDGTAYEIPSAVAVELLRLHLEILGADQAQLSGNPGQLDHFPDATKIVEPSGNSGELPDAVRVPLDSLHADAVYLLSRVKQETLFIHDAAQSIRSRIEATCAAIAQQDADKVDAEQWISVNERLPEIHEWRAGSIAGISDAVLTIDEDDPDTMTVQHLRKGGQGDLTTLYWDHGDSPTHWRPAPSLPGIDAARKEPDQ